METLIQHIVSTPDTMFGKPRIVGRRITVADIAIWHEYQGQSADAIAAEYDLTLSQVYAALTYYFDHREEIQRSLAEDAVFAAEMKAKHPSRLAQRLRG